MRWLALIVSLSLAYPAAALDTNRAALAQDIAILANLVQTRYIEEVSAETVWHRLVEAFRKEARAPDGFDRCTGADALGASTRDHQIAALDAMLKCGAPDDGLRGYADKAMKAFVPSIDPLGSFITKTDLEAMAAQMDEQAGLGLALTKRDEKLEIVRVNEQSPLKAMGFKKGDVIQKIDGHDAAAMTLDDAIMQVRGPAGSRITLSILRQSGNEPEEISLLRTKLRAENFALERHSDVIVLRYYGMGNDGARQLQSALQAPMNKDAKRLVIDLRGNQGGLLDETIALADVFIEKGDLYTIVERRKGDIMRYKATKGDVWKGKPITVLVDKTTENGAEMLAAALQDKGRATILGEKTPGLVMIQTVFPIRMDYAVRLTTSKVFRSGEKPMRGEGVTPDYAIPARPANPTDDWWIDYALQASVRQQAPKSQ